MSRPSSRTLIVVATVVFGLIVSEQLSAQQRRGRGRGGFNPPSRVALATLDSVQQELALTDEQKEAVEAANEQLRSDRRDLFQGGGFGQGDFTAMREKMDKLESEAAAKLNEKLNPEQQKRLTELYIQANGASALTDPAVQEALQVSAEQAEKITAAQEANRQATIEAFQDFGDMSNEERQEANEKLQKDAEEKLLATLTEEQQKSFDELKGETLEMDLSQLRRGRGGFGGGGGRGGRRGGGDNAGGADRPQRPE